jgi:hypothetical protein
MTADDAGQKAAESLLSGAAQPKPGSSIRFRLHWRGVVLVALMTACMTLILVPGMPSKSWQYERRPLINLHALGQTWADYSLMEVDTWSHGWPFEYLQRRFSLSNQLVIIGSLPILWSSPSAWDFSGRIYAFSVLALVADVLICVLIIVATVVGCNSWCRRRAGFRFSLFDAIVFASCVCVILGWWQYHARASAREQAVKAAMINRGSLTDFSKPGPTRARVESNYHGPDWLQRLVGNGYFFAFCIHIDRLYLDTRLLSRDDYADIRELTYVEKVHCVGKLTPELAESLAVLPKLRQLDGEIISFGPPFPEPMFSSSNVELLNQLQQVTTLNLGYSKIEPGDLRHLTQMPSLETLLVQDERFVVEDFDILSDCPNLTTIVADISATEGERAAFEAAHPRFHVSWAAASTLYAREATPATDSWDVASIRFERWQEEDRVSEPQSLDLESLDFSEIKLTRERLRRLPHQRFSKTRELSLGKVDSVETARELIHRCERLQYLDARHIPLTKADVQHLSGDSEYSLCLHLQQAALSVHDFCALIRRAKPGELYIYASSFSRENAAEIADASPHTILQVYHSYDDDEAEMIFPFYEYDPDDPFTDAPSE